jgi:hypothetical protein
MQSLSSYIIAYQGLVCCSIIFVQWPLTIYLSYCFDVINLSSTNLASAALRYVDSLWERPHPNGFMSQIDECHLSCRVNVSELVSYCDCRCENSKALD